MFTNDEKELLKGSHFLEDIELIDKGDFKKYDWMCKKVPEF
jgi:hypothetical protein